MTDSEFESAVSEGMAALKKARERLKNNPHKTGNLAAVMRVMGHSDPRIAMHYQHPDLEVIRQGLNVGSSDARVQ